MGSKIEAKRLMAAAGVPVLAELAADDGRRDDDLPVLIKASAGGGGRGMRVVRSLDVLDREVAAARAEAASAFGDADGVLRAVPGDRTPRRGADRSPTSTARCGPSASASARSSAATRRSIEEAPSPLVERVAGMREALFAAAVAAARAIGYTGAGTVEFLADDDGSFFFLEMNTRLQVEHPVTECTTGVDLVALQIAVAEGGRLDPAPPPSSGHAIEVRLYAEDPAAGWQPHSGTLHTFDVPGVVAEFANPAAPGSASTPASSPARWSASTTTRCSPR